MSIINTVLGTPLGFIIYFAYLLTSSYGIAILLFAVIAGILLFPVNILAHKNSIRLLQIQPSLNNIKRYYSGDRERLNEEQYNLFKREKYNPWLGVIPLIIRLILVIGILQVIYHPLQHILRLPQDVIEALMLAGSGLYGVTGGAGEQLRIIEAMQNPAYISVFQMALDGFPNADSIIMQVISTDLNFLGLNLGEVPSLTTPTIALIIPLFAGLTSLSMCLTQIAVSPGSLSQGRKSNVWLTSTTVGISLWFTLVTPIGVGLYWIAGNIFGIIVLFTLNMLYNPKKLAGEALEQIKAARKTASELREEKQQRKKLRIRERQDVARFKATDKQLVFYAISGGQYKYYKKIIEYILANSDIVIHYLTNDPDDALFGQENEKLLPYYVSQQKTISIMLKLDAEIMVTTVPDLQSYHMKRSIVRDDIEYIFMPHALFGSFALAREAAYDYYDTIFCRGPHHVTEMRRREEIAGFPAKNLVKAGYGLYDQLVESYAEIAHITNEKMRILIAPSWQKDCILDLCIDDVLGELLGKGYVVIVRPHPQYKSMFPERLGALVKKYSNYSESGELVFELDFSDSNSIFQSDLVITDWSAIAFEFSACTLKPSIFINTPMKILNPNYEKFGLELVHISLRDKMGVSVDLDDVKNISETVAVLLNDKDAYKEKIEQVVKQYLYHPGRNGEAGGKYIINQLKKRSV